MELPAPGTFARRLWSAKNTVAADHAPPTGRGFTLIELMIVVAVIGVIAAIAIPNFIKFQARTKQAEAKANLRALWISEKTWFLQHDEYASEIHRLGFSPERGNRYSVLTGGAGAGEDRSKSPAGIATTDAAVSVDTFRFPSLTQWPVATAGTVAPGWIAGAVTGVAAPASPGGVAGTCPLCEFSGYALGNADNDPTIDAWYIGSTESSFTRPDDGLLETVPAGIPSNNYNDVQL
jgi:type IV pilus assembly protein PilA